MKSNQQSKSSRRAFLRGSAVVGGATAVAVAGVASAHHADGHDPAPENGEAQVGHKGYHVTPHIEAYYRLAKF